MRHSLPVFKMPSSVSFIVPYEMIAIVTITSAKLARQRVVACH